MASFFNSNQVIKQGDSKYIDITTAVKVTSTNSKNGCLTVIDTDNSKRVRINKTMLSALGSPVTVNVFSVEGKMIFCNAGDSGDFALKKGGIIYNTSLANQVISAASDIEFKPNASTKCGSFYIQEVSEGIMGAVVTF